MKANLNLLTDDPQNFPGTDETKQAWALAGVVLHIIKTKSLEMGVALFNIDFGDSIQVRLIVTIKPNGEPHALLIPDVKQIPPLGKGFVAYTLWDLIFRQKGYKRLKRCHCGKWFVDYGRNKIKRVCGKKCSNKFWNRTRRRERDKHRLWEGPKSKKGTRR